MFAQVNDLRLAYGDRGREHERALLLVHGFPLDRRLWAAQAGAFGTIARVITPDLRGHGKSTIVPGPFTMDQHADDLAALLDYLKIRRAVVAGLSMGAYVAFAFWRRYPGRVRGLILADTRAEPDSAAARAGRDAAMAKVQQIGAAAYVDEMLPRLLAPDSLADGKIVGAARKMMTEQPAAGIIGASGWPAGPPRQPGYAADDHRAGPGYSRRGGCGHAAGRRASHGCGDPRCAPGGDPQSRASHPDGKPAGVQRGRASVLARSLSDGSFGRFSDLLGKPDHQFVPGIVAVRNEQRRVDRAHGQDLRQQHRQIFHQTIIGQRVDRPPFQRALL